MLSVALDDTVETSLDVTDGLENSDLLPTEEPV